MDPGAPGRPSWLVHGGAGWGGVLGVSSARASWEFRSVAWRPEGGDHGNRKGVLNEQCQL